MKKIYVIMALTTALSCMTACKNADKKAIAANHQKQLSFMDSILLMIFEFFMR